MRVLNRFIKKYPWLIIASVLILTITFGYYAQNVGITTNIKDFFPEGHPQVETFDEIQDTFGGADYIMVAMVTPDIFTYDSLNQLRQVTEQLRRLPGIEQVRSLANVEEVKGSDWGIELASLIGEIPTEVSQLEALRERVLEDEMYGGTMVSLDSTAALIMIEVDPRSDTVEVAAIVSEFVNSINGPEDFYLTGTPVLNHVLADSMKSDLVKLFPIVLLLIAFVLFLYFHSLRGVLLPFITVLISVVWTVGLMGMLGKQLSPLNSVMPVILVSLGNAYGIYILSRYNEEMARGKSSRDAVVATLTSVGLAVLMAGATTVAGFASNITSSITLMVDFGLFTAYGVLIALLISLTLMPALLVVMPGPKKREHKRKKRKTSHDGFLERGLNKLAQTIVNRSGIVIGLTLILVLGAVLGIPRLSTDGNFFNFFDDESGPKIAYELVREKLSGSESIEIVVKGDIQDPGVLNAMDNFQKDLEATGLVGQPQSIVTLLKRTNQALNEGDSEFDAIPGSRELVAQYLLLLEMNDENGLLSKFITMDYQTGRIQALVKDSSSEGTAALFESIESLFDKHFAEHNVTTTQTGIIVLMEALSDMIIQGQIASLLFSVVAVFLIVRLLLRSWEGSILSILLIFVTVLVNFGIMGWSGIALDIVTVLISSIGVGVGIDYSIHVYSRYQEERENGKNAEAAIYETIITTGKAISANAGAVIAGFLILLLSSFPPLRYFGSLVTITMFVASVGSLTILPALIIMRVKKGKIQLKAENL